MKTPFIIDFWLSLLNHLLTFRLKLTCYVITSVTILFYILLISNNNFSAHTSRTYYLFFLAEDIEDCRVSSVAQTQWTPLPEAVCSVVLRLSSQGRPAGLETIREGLMMAFPHVSPPSERVLYDTLAQLAAERKLYQTSSGYFIVTPEWVPGDL